MIKYYCDDKGKAQVEIGLLESIESAEDFSDMLMTFGLEVQAAHLLLVLRAIQLIESLASQTLEQEDIRCIEDALLKWSSVDTDTYRRFKEFIEPN